MLSWALITVVKRRKTWVPVTFKQIKSSTTCPRVVSSVVPRSDCIWPPINIIRILVPITIVDTIRTNCWSVAIAITDAGEVGKSACSGLPCVIWCVDAKFEVPPDAVKNSGAGCTAVEFVDSGDRRCNRNVVPGRCCKERRSHGNVECEGGCAIRWDCSCRFIRVNSTSGLLWNLLAVIRNIARTAYQSRLGVDIWGRSPRNCGRWGTKWWGISGFNWYIGRRGWFW